MCLVIRRFQELAKLCDPEEPKTDKASILAEGIKLITQLRLENGQLRQLNKYLEVASGQRFVIWGRLGVSPSHCALDFLGSNSAEMGILL